MKLNSYANSKKHKKGKRHIDSQRDIKTEQRKFTHLMIRNRDIRPVLRSFAREKGFPCH